MKIKELYIEKYKCFQEPIRLSFEDSLNGGILNRALITGANGSGKTTILELILNFLSVPLGGISNNLLTSVGYLDIEFRPEEVLALGFNDSTDKKTLRCAANYLSKQTDILVTKNNRLEFPSPYGMIFMGFFNKMISQIEKLEFLWGGVVYFPHYRSFPGSTGNARTNEAHKFKWTTTVASSGQAEGSLYNYLRWLEDEDLRSIKYGPVQTHKFEDALIEINGLLTGKKINRIDEKGRIIVTVEGSDKVQHPIEELSSGEKQLLLMLIEISRHCWPGSILLIDEPEISLHTTMQLDLLFMLEKICKKKDIQLIMATHSETIFNHVFPHERIILTSLTEKKAVKV